MPPAEDTCHTPLHAEFYADRASFSAATVIENVRTARDTYRMRIDSAAIAERITPGQFLMVRLAGQTDPMLGRAFALYDVIRDRTDEGAAIALDFVYVKKGKLTTPLAECEPGRQVEVWGPLGNGFSLPATDHLIMVAGGIGQTPFLALGKECLGRADYGEASRDSTRVANVSLCYGVRSADLLAGEEDFRAAGIDLRIASDDGSIGHHGLVTDLLKQVVAESAGESPLVVCCGPEPMMQATAEVSHELGLRCLVSLETPMACGIGICFSCVAKVRQEEDPHGEMEWDYKRTCVEGPVFDAEKIVW